MCWHKWSKWGSPELIRCRDDWGSTWTDLRQVKTCIKCGKVKTRRKKI